MKMTILIVMDNSTHEEHLSQPLQTNIIKFKIAITFLTGYNGIFNVTDKNKKFYFIKSITDKDSYIQISIPKGAFEIESLNKEIERITIDHAHYTSTDYAFTINPNFSTLGSVIEISSQRPVITFVPDDNIRYLLGFTKTRI